VEKIKLAVFVSGGGTNLQALIDAQKNGIIENGEIMLVVSSNPDAYAVVRAEKEGITTAIVDKKLCKTQNEFEDKLSEELEKHSIEIIVLAGFMCILSERFTRLYDRRIINVHPSLIPSFCGKGFYGIRVHKAALEKGVKVTGATVHFVNEIPDGGEIIMQKAVAVHEGDTPETLQKRVMRLAEWKILPEAVEKVCRDMKEKC
jgi:phosphoribosylglycinamide formyltransferase